MTPNDVPHPHTRLAPAFLDQVEGEEALAWVHQQNLESRDAFGSSREVLESEILTILDSPDRIPLATYRNGYAYNFWTDATHPRGLWRRQSFKSYLAGEDAWETLVDLDELALKEGESWVWRGAQVRYPQGDRALITLSAGGTDATETREFDLETLSWVSDGFYRPRAKGSLRWVDFDHCWLTQAGPDQETSASGYPLQARLLKRGQPLVQAPIILAGSETDMGVWAGSTTDRSGKHSLISVQKDFYSSTTYWLPGGSGQELLDGSPLPLDVPESAEVTVWNEWVLLWLRDEWQRGNVTRKAGSILAFPLTATGISSNDDQVWELFVPTANEVMVDLATTANRVVVTTIRDVITRVFTLTPPQARSQASQRAWNKDELEFPNEDQVSEGSAPLTLSAWAVAPAENDDLWVVSSGYLQPQSLWLVQGGEWSLVRQAPALFSTEGLTVEQHFATSKDGTRIPYFQVGPNRKTPGPTLLYGYGGFNVSLLPSYAPVVGKCWLEKGGTYVVANIRGGGEYGPDWHQSALKGNRHRAYEDFAAVAQDLLERGVTTPTELGIQGGSNGGLLVGNMYTHYPQLFGAVVCQVPLLDMGRYHTLLAGHSWIAEYGDPENTEDWQELLTFSPLHQFRAQNEYPPLLLTTSTKDDRVHPAHARTFGYLAQEHGKEVLYYENVEGGHGGAADSKQRAYMQSLAWAFLHDKLQP